MTTTSASVKGAEAAAAAAKGDVDRAEADLASGTRSITATALHKLRDGWRHADLAAKGARVRAEQERRDARLKGLEMIGIEIDKIAASGEAGALEAALRDVAAACARVRQLAGAHDATVTELVDAAADLGAEPPAPGGPRATSARVAFRRDRANGDAVMHGRTLVRPVGHQVQAALTYAMEGDADRAVAEALPVTVLPEPKRPEYVLRHQRSGNIIAMTDLNQALQAQVRSGDLEILSGHDVDRYMEGTLG